MAHFHYGICLVFSVNWASLVFLLIFTPWAPTCFSGQVALYKDYVIMYLWNQAFFLLFSFQSLLGRGNHLWCSSWVSPAIVLHPWERLVETVGQCREEGGTETRWITKVSWEGSVVSVTSCGLRFRSSCKCSCCCYISRWLVLPRPFHGKTASTSATTEI